MARIESYNQDPVVDGKDKLIGTKSSTKETSNYTIDSIGAFLSENNAIKIGDQLNYLMVDAADDIANGTFFVEGFGADGNSMSDFDVLHICKFNNRGQSVEQKIRKILAEKIIIGSITDENEICLFSTTSVTQSDVHPDFIRVTLSGPSGNGSFTVGGEYYSFLMLSSASDKEYVHTQSVPQSTWNVSHGLKKKPSVTIVDSADDVVYGDITYVDNNNVTINFSGAFSGKAYFN